MKKLIKYPDKWHSIIIAISERNDCTASQTIRMAILRYIAAEYPGMMPHYYFPDSKVPFKAFAEARYPKKR